MMQLTHPSPPGLSDYFNLEPLLLLSSSARSPAIVLLQRCYSNIQCYYTCSASTVTVLILFLRRQYILSRWRMITEYSSALTRHHIVHTGLMQPLRFQPYLQAARKLNKYPNSIQLAIKYITNIKHIAVAVYCIVFYWSVRKVFLLKCEKLACKWLASPKHCYKQ